MTDDELRNLIKTKFSTIIGAFRAFDKNGDGCVSKTEFFKGLRGSGVDLPKDQLEQLWKMADEDGRTSNWSNCGRWRMRTVGGCFWGSGALKGPTGAIVENGG